MRRGHRIGRQRFGAPGWLPVTGVRYQSADGIATLTLDEVENKNALSATLVRGLNGALERALADPDVRAIVITNDGNTFCAGADLRAGAERSKTDVVPVFNMILDAPKPVVARIAGHCVAGGVGLAAACDISVIDERARLGFTEVRIGVVPAIISLVCLPKLTRADASDLMLSGRRITGAEAARIGLVNYAVAAEELDQKVAELLGELLAGGPIAIQETKRLIRSMSSMASPEAFAAMTELSTALFASDEAAEGMAAFREKRPAAWIPGSCETADAKAY